MAESSKAHTDELRIGLTQSSDPANLSIAVWRVYSEVGSQGLQQAARPLGTDEITRLFDASLAAGYGDSSRALQELIRERE